jgi:glycosyltransferase involved in cell wall biosynthesis
MRVLHVIPSMAPLDGGPTVAVQHLASALAATGVDVTIATTDSDGAGGRLDMPNDGPVQDGDVEYHYFARELPGTWKLSRGLARWLRANVARFDVAHVHALFCHSTIAGCRTARDARVPYVLSPHGSVDPWSMNRRSWKKAPYFRLVEREHFARAAALHATAETEAAAIRALGYADRVRIIPLGVEEMGVMPHVRGDGALRLLFLSRLHPKKGIPMLLDAVARARSGGTPVELAIAGEGPDAYKNELLARVQQLGLSSAVRFVGHIEGESKRAAFASSDVYVLASHQENFGIAVAEAMWAGLPVIVSDQVGIASDVKQARAGVVVPVDTNALVAAIQRLAREPDERRSMGARASQFAASRYSWERAAREFLELYTSIASHGVRRHA